MPDKHYEIGKCTRCSLAVMSGKPDVDYVIVPGFGITKDFLWHIPCAEADNDDPNSHWYKQLIVKVNL